MYTSQSLSLSLYIYIYTHMHTYLFTGGKIVTRQLFASCVLVFELTSDRVFVCHVWSTPRWVPHPMNHYHGRVWLDRFDFDTAWHFGFGLASIFRAPNPIWPSLLLHTTFDFDGGSQSTRTQMTQQRATTTVQQPHTIQHMSHEQETTHTAMMTTPSL